MLRTVAVLDLFLPSLHCVVLSVFQVNGVFPLTEIVFLWNNKTWLHCR